MSVGVSWLTVFSAQSPRVWQTPLTSHSQAWRDLSLPVEESVQWVASGLAHTLILSNVGNGS